MKARIIYLATLMMTMFVLSACSNEDEFSDITNDKNLMTENVEIFEIDCHDVMINCKSAEKFSEGILYHCFEDKNELDDLYTINDASKLLNWNNRTLVMVNVFYPSQLNENITKKVYKKGRNYVIEILEGKGIARFHAHDHKCFGILLDTPKVNPENIQIKVGIYQPESINDKGEVKEAYYHYSLPLIND